MSEENVELQHRVIDAVTSDGPPLRGPPKAPLWTRSGALHGKQHCLSAVKHHL
jgi:hypothetical protein